MAQRQRIELIVEAAQPRKHSIATNIEDMDVALDYATGPEQIRALDVAEKIAEGHVDDDVFIKRAVVAPFVLLLAAHASATHRPWLRKMLEEKERPDARFYNEVDAVRGLYDAGARIRDGKQEAFRKKLLLGTTRVQSQVRNIEPTVDPHLEIVERAIGMVPAEDFRWFFWSYVELDPPEVVLKDLGPVDQDGRKRGGREKEAKTRKLKAKREDALKDDEIESLHREGKSAFSIAYAFGKGEGSLPPRSRLKASDNVTAAVLVAEKAGLITEATPEEQYLEKAQPVVERVRGVRAQLRKTLLEENRRREQAMLAAEEDVLQWHAAAARGLVGDDARRMNEERDRRLVAVRADYMPLYVIEPGATR